MRESDRSGLVAGTGVAFGVVLMFAGVYLHAEDGPNLRTWAELRLAKRLFYAGASIALVVPVVAFLAGRRWRRADGGKKSAPDDEIA